MKKVLFVFIFALIIMSCKKEVAQTEDPIPDNVYVRIESVSKDGTTFYSPIVRVLMKN